MVITKIMLMALTSAFPPRVLQAEAELGGMTGIYPQA